MCLSGCLDTSKRRAKTCAPLENGGLLDAVGVPGAIWLDPP
jgi:hypothetical protein